MKKDLVIAKIQSYLDILNNKQFYNIHDGLKLQGVIYKDDALSDKEEITLEKGLLWSHKECTYHVKTQIVLERKSKGDLFLCLDLGKSIALEAISFLYGPEGLVSIDGEEVFGMDPYHKLNKIPDRFIDGKEHELYLNGWTGIKEEQYQVNEIMLCQRYTAIYELLLHTKVILDLVQSESYEDYRCKQILNLYFEMVNSLDFDIDGGELNEKVRENLTIYKKTAEQYTDSEILEIYACGHGHLDIAWLWDIDRSKNKAAQTFNNVLAIQDVDSSLHFSQTQMQLYEYIEQEYPETFKRVKESIHNGNWEVLGKSWVEFDSNMTGSEALVRQFVIGQNYIDQKLDGYCSPVAWLPDTFGFTGQLPQILKGVGIDYFATAKLTWNGYNKFPYESFNWVGIDGTSVVSHVVSTSKPGWWGATYSADMTVQEIEETKRLVEQKEKVGELLVPFGRGDGGGGPTKEMSDTIDIMKQYSVLPSVEKTTFIDFFEKLEQKKGKLDTWNGELYFELHRGTYTSQAKTKKGNRESENLIHTAEFLATWVDKLGIRKYPHEDFESLWKMICLSQFHDILPGSSIQKVYERVEKEYKTIKSTLLNSIAQSIYDLQKIMPENADYVVLNPSPVVQTKVIEICDTTLENSKFSNMKDEMYHSEYKNGISKIYIPDVPAYSFVYIKKVEEGNVEKIEAVSSKKNEAGEYILENNLIKVTINQNGQFLSIVDKEVEREIISEQQVANEWLLYEDIPADWEAWDIEEYYKEKVIGKVRIYETEIIDDAKLKTTLLVKGKIGKSTICQEISVEHNSKAITCKTTVDWKESRKLLKVDFPVEIHNKVATFDVQWGNVTRPTTANTTWEQAQFESSAHKWVDLSEGNYGVSIINDCKYGYSIKENIMTLTALKSAKFPDETADMGKQEFTYSILPHVGNNLEKTIREGYTMNLPITVYDIKGETKEEKMMESFIKPGKQILIETIKKAENHKGIILRGYEWNNTRGIESMVVPDGYKNTHKCNLLETIEKDIQIENCKIKVDFKPYEIITLKLCNNE